jgi:hypothetical protein
MKKTLAMATVGLSLSASVLAAQANTCPAGGSTTTPTGAQANVVRDACLQAVDMFNLMAPQLGLALVGGNATLGQGGTLGGLGHFAISIRGNVFKGDLPEVDKFPLPRNSQTLSSQVLPSKKQYLGLPVLDAAIGVFKGIPLGLTNVGGVDLLVSATYVPKIGSSGDDFQVVPNSSTKFGFGARLGLLQESLVVPGISATYFKRDVPTTTIIGTSTNLDIKIQDADIKTTAWRIVANKNFIIFGLAAGFGQDKYQQGTSVSGTVKNVSTTISGVTVNTGNQPFGPIVLQQDVTRTNMFADLSVNLFLFKLVGEVGQASGGTFPAASNTFSSGKMDDSRTYASVGLRIGF